jgi:predicted nucleotidyltransferase
MAVEARTIDVRALAERGRMLRMLRKHEADLRALGDADPDSDVDLIADIDPHISFSLLDLVGLQEFLCDLLGRKVDVGTTVAKMRPRSRERFEAEAVEVF